MKLKIEKAISLGLIFLFLFVIHLDFTFAQTQDMTANNLPAIDGYDPVAYFPEGGGKAMRGNSYYAYPYKSRTYQCSSEANWNALKANPEHYIPKYGGWCATSMALGNKIAAKPTMYKAREDGLYFFSSRGTQIAWDANGVKLKPRADENWKALQPPEESST